MTEALAVSVLFVLMFAMLWGAMAAYRGKMRAMEGARVGAWEAALNGCDDKAGSTLSEIASEAPSIPDGEPLPDNQASKPYVDIEETQLGQDWGVKTVPVTNKVTLPGLLGGSMLQMKASMSIRCNERQASHGLMEFLDQAMDVLTPNDVKFL